MKIKWSKFYTSDLFYIATLFLISNLVHFAILIGVEMYFSTVIRSFYFDWYSVIVGFSTGLCLNALVAAALVFYQLIGLNESAQNWTKAAKFLCLCLPLGPLLDWIFHVSTVIPYTGYRNAFSAEIPLFSRIMGVIIPGRLSGIVDVPVGYRIIFVLLSVINAIYIFRYTRNYVRSALVFMMSYFSVCLIIGSLSPSDLPPLTILKNLFALPIAAWAANLFLIRRIQESKS